MRIIVLVLIILLFYIKLLNKNVDKFVTQKQLNFKRTLQDMKDILDKNNITFFLYCGTCLGAHRERKFIDHDPDIDIGVLDNEFYKISSVLNNYKSVFYQNKFYPSSDINTACEICYIHRKTNIKIDIFKVTKKKEGYIHYSYTSICADKKNKRCEFVNNFKFETINFLGRNYKIPDKDFLISHYGHDWNKVKKFTYEEGLKENGYKSLK